MAENGMIRSACGIFEMSKQNIREIDFFSVLFGGCSDKQRDRETERDFCRFYIYIKI